MSDLKTQIEGIIEEIRPSLALHGGDAQLAEIGENFIKLKLKGACHGCPMAAMTFGIFLEEEIKTRIPQIQTVLYE